MWLITFGILLFLLIGLYMHAYLRRPRRHYEDAASVSSIYNNWTNDQVLEFYWGDHLHAGYYGDPPVKKDFVTAKKDMIEEMIRWGIEEPVPKLMEKLSAHQELSDSEKVKVLDVGCGIGGTVRHLARRWRETAHITGITISSRQAERATTLAREESITNVTFIEGDAMRMAFSDSCFEIVWAVESEAHMPDKQKFIQEMARVLKPGGILVMSAWNVRDTHTVPLSKRESEHVRFLVDDWCHASFTSILDYTEKFKQQGLVEIVADDWSVQTQPSWRHAVSIVLRNPKGLFKARLRQQWEHIRDAYMLLRYDNAFGTGLCQYGMIRGQKLLTDDSTTSSS